MGIQKRGEDRGSIFAQHASEHVVPPPAAGSEVRRKRQIALSEYVAD